jgi:hypothetical protein
MEPEPFAGRLGLKTAERRSGRWRPSHRLQEAIVALSTGVAAHGRAILRGLTMFPFCSYMPSTRQDQRSEVRHGYRGAQNPHSSRTSRKRSIGSRTSRTRSTGLERLSLEGNSNGAIVELGATKNKS